MGLDQFAYTIANNGDREALMCWRKHPNLQGWMEDKWHEKGCPNKPDDPNSLGMSDFNCVPLELTAQDLTELEAAITNSELPETCGFFFGDDSDDYYREQDLDFIKKAREALAAGLPVFYDSWW
jgi:hypothetical protein